MHMADNVQRADFGMIGLRVMGRNLALNIEEHGFTVAVWNRTTKIMQQFIAENPGKRLVGAVTLEELVNVVSRPRRIMLMIEAGPAVDDVITALRMLLEPGDIVIDGGNSWFKDTQRRGAKLAGDDISYVGTGISGGELGARFGPSIMPGGPREAYEHLRPVFEAIAAKTESGPCVTYIGPDGSGHFVKMVHNGIEYGDMQLIAEAYDILRKALGLTADELADIFAQWNDGPLESFLMELTAHVLRVRDEQTGRPLVDLVLDRAAQKGTGKWAVNEALELGVPIPTISAAVYARMLSSMKDERVEASKVLQGPLPARYAGDRELLAAVRSMLLGAKIGSYAQGMGLIRAGSLVNKWNVDMKEIARIWKGGCIIRARLLDFIMKAYGRRPDLANLLLDDQLSAEVARVQPGWRLAAQAAQGLGIPIPATSASLAYYDGYRAENLPQNLTQAQRDAFGAHTYERIDHPELGLVHTDWEELPEGSASAG